MGPDEPQSWEEKVRECAAGSGVGIVGFARTEGIADTLHDSIAGVARGLDRAISLAYRLSDEVLDTVSRGPSLIYKHHYKTVNWILDQCAARVASLIQSSGGRALSIPASQTVDWEGQRGHLSHKAVARASGLGWIGRSGLLVNREHGARLRFSTVLTDLPLETGGPVDKSCGDCVVCMESCPAGAISNGGYSMEKCLSELKRFAAMPGMGVYICGVCVKACPFDG